MFTNKHRDKINWDELSAKLSANQLKGFAAAGGYLSETLFGISIPLPQFDIEDKKTVILAGTLQFPLLSTEKKDLQHVKRHLMLCQSNKERAAFLFRYVALWLKPNMRDMEGVRLPRSLFPLYYIIRRFRFLRGKLEKK